MHWRLIFRVLAVAVAIHSSAFAGQAEQADEKSQIPTFEQFERDPLFDAFMVTLRTAGNFALLQGGLTTFQHMAPKEALNMSAFASVLSGLQQVALNPMYQWEMHHGLVAPFKKDAKPAGLSEIAAKEYFYQLLYYSMVHMYQVAISSGNHYLSWTPFCAAFWGLLLDGFVYLFNFRVHMVLKDKWEQKLQDHSLDPVEVAKIAKQMRWIVRGKKAFASLASVGGTFLVVMAMQENGVWAKYISTGVGVLGILGTAVLYRDSVKESVNKVSARVSDFGLRTAASCRSALSALF